MSFAKRCGVAIATRWTLVIFAACKEAMAFRGGSGRESDGKKAILWDGEPPSTPWKINKGSQSQGALEDDFSFQTGDC